MDYNYGLGGGGGGGGDYYRRGHVPAFGSWEWNDAVPFTQCFETATTTHHQQQQSTFLHYSQDRDLYNLNGDLYDNNHHHLVTPAVILLPRRRARVGQEPVKRSGSKEHHNYNTEAREFNAPVVKRRMKAPKPVDEDLYKISPQVVSVEPKKKRGGGFGCIPRCFLPTQVL